MRERASADIDVAALLARLGARPHRITSDSRAVEPGVAFAAYPGSVARWSRIHPRCGTARCGGGALGSERLRLGSGDRGGEPAGRRPEAEPRFDRGFHLRKPVAGAVDDRCHRHERQDVVHAVDRAGVRAVRPKRGRHRHARATDSSVRSSQRRTRRRMRPCCTRRSRGCKAGGAQVVAMEVSSIGLEQGRVNGAKFDVAMFTNLSRDHLDYHGTMAAYGAAKARLFAWPTLLAAVINTDDDFGKGLVDQMRGHAASRLTYGLSGAEITATSITTIVVGHGARRRDAVGTRRAAHVARRHVQRIEPARNARRASREQRSAGRCAGRDGRRSRRRLGAWNGTAAASSRSS